MNKGRERVKERKKKLGQEGRKEEGKKKRKEGREGGRRKKLQHPFSGAPPLSINNPNICLCSALKMLSAVHNHYFLVTY